MGWPPCLRGVTVIGSLTGAAQSLPRLPHQLQGTISLSETRRTSSTLTGPIWSRLTFLLLWPPCSWQTRRRLTPPTPQESWPRLRPYSPPHLAALLRPSWRVIAASPLIGGEGGSHGPTSHLHLQRQQGADGSYPRMADRLGR